MNADLEVASFNFYWYVNEECIGKVTISKICLACQIDHCFGSLLTLSADLLTAQ